MSGINDSFLEFVARLSTSTQNEPVEIKAYREQVYKVLADRVELTHFFEGGAWNNGTNIPFYDSVDYFAVIDTPLLNPHTLLENVANGLKLSFPELEVYVAAPKITLAFGHEAIETLNVIPAKYFETTSQGYGVYGIADPHDKWLRTSPNAHKDFLKTLDETYHGQAKGLIRLLRAWKYYQFVPVSAFYLEMQAIKHIQNGTGIIYALDTRTILEHLWDTQLAPIHNPEAINALIQPCRTEAEKRDTLMKLEQALNFLTQAHRAEIADDIAWASHWWNTFYQGHFTMRHKIVS